MERGESAADRGRYRFQRHPNLIALFRGLLRDPRVPRRAKLWLWFAIARFASPNRPVPELVPLAGPLVDEIVAALVLRYLVRRTPMEGLFEHGRRDPRALRSLFGREEPASHGIAGRDERSRARRSLTTQMLGPKTEARVVTPAAPGLITYLSLMTSKIEG
jgi:uncharacterized membrane protein YkvA (DUF1232 family)